MDAPRVGIVGGNCNNGSNCGPRYVNLNNTASNSNWNIGASATFRIAHYRIHNSSPLGENEFVRRNRLVGSIIVLETRYDTKNEKTWPFV